MLTPAEQIATVQTSDQILAGELVTLEDACESFHNHTDNCNICRFDSLLCLTGQKLLQEAHEIRERERGVAA